MLCHIVYRDRFIRMLGNILYAGKDLPGHPGRNFLARYPLCKINQHRILQRIDIVCPTEFFHLLDIIVALQEMPVCDYAPDKLYHSYMVYGKSEVKIGALIKGQPVYVRVDAFNESGIEEGDVKQV